MKCDEAKPLCQRCVSTGRKCDGYRENAPKIQRPSSTISPGSDTSNAQLIRLCRSPSTAIDGSEREVRSFSYFCQRTAPQLTGFFFGDNLWDFVLRASHHEPAIRHAVIALGSLHEKFMEHGRMIVTSKPELSRDDFPLREYTVAIQTLVRPLMDQKNQPVDVCLIACIIFTCFEVTISPHIYAFIMRYPIDNSSNLTVNRACKAVTGLPLLISTAVAIYCVNYRRMLGQGAQRMPFLRARKYHMLL